MREKRLLKFDAKLLPWALFAAVLVVYLLFPTKNYYWDGIDFSYDIERAASSLDPSLVHANHLLYSPLGHLAYRLARGLGFDARAVEALQVKNALLSALCALLLFHVLRRVTRSAYVAFSLALLFAFSATWWKFSTDADSYVVTTLFLVAALRFLLPDERPRPLLVALLHAAAMLFHQLAVFFYPAAVVGLLLQTTSLPPRRRLLLVLQYTAAAVLLTVAVYYYCFNLKTGLSAPADFLRWTSSYSSGSGGFSFDFGDNLAYTLRGHVRLFAGGRITMLDGLLNPSIVALLALLCAAVVALVVQLVRTFGGLRAALRRLARPRRLTPVELLAVAWVAPYLVFCFFFYPSDTFHRLVYLPALVLLLASALVRLGASERGPLRFRLALFVAALSLANFCFLIYPFAHTHNNPPLATALGMRERLGPSSVVYYAQTNGDQRLFRYFNPAADWKQLARGDADAIDRELRDAESSGRNVWLETTALTLLQSYPRGRQWLDSRDPALPKVELVNDRYVIRFWRLR